MTRGSAISEPGTGHRKLGKEKDDIISIKVRWR